ncbi:MAG: hypothetical protein AAGI52_03890 [Bacteroidota bacterium]
MKGSPAEPLIGQTEAMEAVSEASADLDFRAFEILQSDLSTGEKVRRVDALLNDPSLEPAVRWLSTQSVAHLALAGHTALPGLLDASEPETEAIGHFVDELIQVGSPHADLVLQGLNELKGTWPQQRIATAAASAADHAEQWVRESCSDCELKAAAISGEEAADTKEAILLSIERLRRE